MTTKIRSAFRQSVICSSGMLFFCCDVKISNLFSSAISTAIGALVREIEAICDPAFQTMARTAWPNVNQVSGQSAYAGELVNAAEQVVDALKPLVEQKKYLRNFLDKSCRFVFISQLTQVFGL